MSDLHTAADFGLIDHIRALDERVGRLEIEFEKTHLKSSGIDGDAGDWTAAKQDESGFPVQTLPSQYQADEAAKAIPHETVNYEDGSSTYGPVPVPRVNPQGSPAKD